MTALFRRLNVLSTLLAILLLSCAAFAAEGQFVSETFHSKALENNLLGDSPDRNVLVYLPPSYDSSPERHYPVVYLLHGWTMHSLDWIGRDGWGGQFDISEALDAFMTANPTRELIVVMPDAFNKYLGSWYTNSPVTGNWEDFLTQELVAHTDATYRTLPERPHRGIAGYSMGGAGAWRIATRYPELYAALYDLDGGLTGDAVSFTRPQNAWRTILAGTADSTTNPLELGTGAAFSPNPNNPPYYLDAPYEMSGDSLVYIEAIAERWVHAYDVVDMLRMYPASLPQLRAVRFGYSKGEGPKSARVIAQTLARLGIAYVMEEYEGNHTDHLAARVGTRLLPFMARALHGELPKVRSANLELGAVEAGQSLPEVSVVLGAPPEATGTFPELSLDLSSLGIADPLPMRHDGKGRYTAIPPLSAPQTGPYYLTLNLEEGAGARFPLSLLSLAVWPAGDMAVIAEGVAEGWELQGQLKGTLDPQATAQVYQGNTALAVQANGTLKVTLSSTQPVSPLGYAALRFAFHPGDADGLGAGEALYLGVGAKKYNLWRPGQPGENWLDLAAKSWQVVEIPLEELSPYIPFSQITFSGKLTGTFYLDDVRLVVSPVPPPPPTAVEEERTAALPQSFSLAQNYPNPFNSGTMVQFSLPQSAEIELTIYNLAGQKVVTLVKGRHEAGAYTVHWDGKNDREQELASGIYFYRLEAGPQVETRKLLLLR